MTLVRRYARIANVLRWNEQLTEGETESLLRKRKANVIHAESLVLDAFAKRHTYKKIFKNYKLAPEHALENARSASPLVGKDARLGRC